MHDSNSIFRARGINSEIFSGGTGTTAKATISARIRFLARTAVVALLDWLLARWAGALRHDSTFCAVTQQQSSGYVHMMLCCRLASRHPFHQIPGQLLGLSHSRRMKDMTGSLNTYVHLIAVTKASDVRTRFTTHDSTLDLGKVRDGADYNSNHQRLFLPVRSSAFTRGETGIGSRISRRWLKHLDDENLDVIDTEIENCISKDLPEVCASVRPVSVLDYCQIVISALVM